MRLYEIGHEIRRRRRVLGLTQDELARAAGLSRVTVNQLENGSAPDLGVNKLIGVLSCLGLVLSTRPRRARLEQDYVEMACATASTSFRQRLTPEELALVVTTGRVPERRRPQLRAIFDDVPPSILEGAVAQIVGARAPVRAIERLSKVAARLGTHLRPAP